MPDIEQKKNIEKNLEHSDARIRLAEANLFLKDADRDAIINEYQKYASNAQDKLKNLTNRNVSSKNIEYFLKNNPMPVKVSYDQNAAPEQQINSINQQITNAENSISSLQEKAQTEPYQKDRERAMASIEQWKNYINDAQQTIQSIRDKTQQAQAAETNPDEPLTMEGEEENQLASPAFIIDESKSIEEQISDAENKIKQAKTIVEKIKPNMDMADEAHKQQAQNIINQWQDYINAGEIKLSNLRSQKNSEEQRSSQKSAENNQIENQENV